MLLLDISRDHFLQALQVVMGIVEKRHTLPILSNVLIEKTGDGLSLLSSDMEIQIKVTVVTDNACPDFSFTVSARKIFDICKAISSTAHIKIDSGASNNQILIRSNKSRFNLQTLPANDFPIASINSDQEMATLFLTEMQLKKLITQVQYAMAQQDVRYYLNGMFLAIDKNTITVVATDGHRLCVSSIESNQNCEHKEVIIPRKTVNELVKLLTLHNDPVQINLYNNQVEFVVRGVQIISKVIEGKFPDYHRVIPIHHTNKLSVSRVVLLQALQRAAILSNDKFPGVRFVLSQNEIKIICKNNEQEEAEEEIEVEYHGDALDIGFNVLYLLDALTQLDNDTILCHFGDATSSMLITLPDDDSYKYVIMPMRI